MKLFTMAAVAASSLIAAPLFAAGLPTDADVDGNGSYTLEELKTAYPQITEEVFAKVDVNADGEANAEEVQAALDAGLLVEG